MDTNTNIFIKDISYSIENFELSLVLNRKEIDMLSSATGLHDAFFFSESVELDAYYKIEEYYMDIHFKILDNDNILLSFFMVMPESCGMWSKEDIEIVVDYLSKLLQIDESRFYISRINSHMILDSPDEDYLHTLGKHIKNYYYLNREGVDINCNERNRISKITVNSEHDIFIVDFRDNFQMLFSLESDYHQINKFFQENSLSSSNVKDQLQQYFDVVPVLFTKKLEPIGINKYIFD